MLFLIINFKVLLQVLSTCLAHIKAKPNTKFTNRAGFFLDQPRRTTRLLGWKVPSLRVPFRFDPPPT